MIDQSKDQALAIAQELWLVERKKLEDMLEKEQIKYGQKMMFYLNFCEENIKKIIHLKKAINQMVEHSDQPALVREIGENAIAFVKRDLDD